MSECLKENPIHPSISTSSNLPEDIITIILSRLPVKSLCRFRCVSESWCSLIGDPHFVKMHLNQATLSNNTNLMLSYHSKFYSIDYDTSYAEALEIDNNPFKSVKISGSCNGLLFIHFDLIDAIWNPSTKEFKQLPPTPYTIDFSEEGELSRYVVFGFGYDCSIHDYKAVRVVHYFDLSIGVESVDPQYLCAEVEVYTLGIDLWRRIDDLDVYIFSREDQSLFVNGTINWLANAESMLKKPDLIVCFHLALEKFGLVPLPEFVVHRITCLGVLGGSLSFLNEIDTYHADLWVMKDYGVKESWTNLYTISRLTKPYTLRLARGRDFLVLLCISNTGEVLLHDHTGLLLYNPKLEMVEPLWTHGLPEFFEATPYVGSLVSLKSGTFVWKKQVKQKRTQSIGGKTRW